jgi:two-component system, sensor histidine kinase PdtaS
MKAKPTCAVSLIFILACPLAYAQQKQVSMLDSINGLAEQAGTIESKIDVWYKAAKAKEKSNPEILAAISNQMKKESQLANYSIGIGLAYEVKGFGNSLRGEYDSAIQNFRIAIGYLATDSAQLISSARLHHNILMAFDNKGKVDSVFRYATLQMVEAEQSNDSISRAYAMHDMGRYLFRKNSNQKASKLFFDALALVESKTTSDILINILNAIALTYRRLGNNGEAHRFIEKSVKAAHGIPSPNLRDFWLAYSYNQLANFYLTEKDSIKSLETIDLQLIHARKSESLSQIYSAHLNRAWFYNNNKEFGKVIEEYKAALATQHTIKNKRSIGVVHYNLCATYYDMEQYKLAVLHGDSAIVLFKDVGDSAWESDTYYNLGLAYNGLGKFKEAYDVMEKYANMSYEVLGEDNNQKIAEMQAAYDVEKKDAAIAVLNKENELKNSQRNFFVAVAGSLLVMVLLSLYLYRQKQKSNSLLTEKNSIIEKSLHERESLLKEIHHRVKNNLQIISSLLSLQSKSLTDTDAQGAISESRNRVKSMSLIHEQLYQEDTISGVDMKDYLHRLVSSLSSSYGLDTDRVEIKIVADNILLDVDSAIPLGLIINELVSNSMKYAFPEKKSGTILVSLHEMMSELKLIVQDDGVGMDVSKKSNQSFGLSMVNSLMRKLKAEMNIVSEAGTSVELVIRDFRKVAVG